MTLDQVKALTFRQTVYHKTLRNADGTPLRARVNGKVKTWKRDPDRVCVPMKHGLKECFYIGTDYGCSPIDEWEIDEDAARRSNL